MGEQVRVSVVLPLLDPGPSIDEALERLLATTSERDEIVLVDDGSSPPSAAVLRRFAGTAHRTPVRLLANDTNEGVAAARNRALRVARGRFVWFVDWDDQWDPQILDVLVGRAERTGAALVTCRAAVVDQTGHLVRRIGPAHDTELRGIDTARAILDGRIEGHLWNKLFRREVLPDRMFPPMRAASDFSGAAPVVVAAAHISHVGRVLYAHCMRPGSITTAPDRDLTFLEQSGDLAEQVVRPYLTHRGAARTLRLFRYRGWYLIAVTAMRINPDPAYQEHWLQRSRQRMRASEAASLLAASPGTASRCLSLLALGPRFRHVYRVSTATRSRLRERHPYRLPWRG